MIKALEVLQSIEELETGRKVKIETIYAKVISELPSIKMQPCNDNKPKDKYKLESAQKLQIFKNETTSPIKLKYIDNNGVEQDARGIGAIPNDDLFMIYLIPNLTIKFIDANGECIGIHTTQKKDSILIIE